MAEENNKRIIKLGCTNWIEFRKWWGATERLHPSYYEWYIKIINLGNFKCIRSAEQTIFRHPFFSKRKVDNGIGSGDEFYEFYNYDNECQKACEILTQYGAVFQVIKGDPFLTKPSSLPKEEEKIAPCDPLLPLTQPVTEEIKLRPYQDKCLKKMMSVPTGIIVAATGIGKTIIMCMYMKDVGGKYLIVVPSKTLVAQTVKTCKNILGDSFTIQGYDDNINHWLSKRENVVIVGLYQSSHKLQRLEGLNCIIFDECHSTVVLNPPTDKKGERKLSRFQQLLHYECDRKFFFTATEKNIQADGKVVSMDRVDVYGEVIFRYDLASAVKDGWLCDYLFHLVATDNRIDSCIKYVKSGYKSVIFCGRQDTVEKVCEILCKKLPNSIKVFKLGDSDDIQTNTRSFSDYKGQAVIIACRKITMGYDEPQIDTVIHYDLTTSSIMTHQRNGRTFRLWSDKVMATLVFLCDVSGDKEIRRGKIRQLHLPIAHLKEMDGRFEERVEKERMKIKGEFRIVEVIVNGNFDVTESKEVYDRCWRMVDGAETTYQKAKEIIKLSKPQSWKEYLELCDRDSRLYNIPEDVYKSQFEGRVEYLGLNRDNYISLQDYKKSFSEYNTNMLKLSEICICLEERSRFPPADLVVDMYRLNQLNDIISQKNSIEITDDEFDRMFT